jgi:hypothetical protein
MLSKCKVAALRAGGWFTLTAAALLTDPIQGEVGKAPRTREEFKELHALVKPHRTAGEAAWDQFPWMTDLWEARRKAAAEGKPILIWMASGHPLGQC